MSASRAGPEAPEPTRFPSDFGALLTPKGHALVEGRHEACGCLQSRPFFSASDLLTDEAKAAMPGLLQRTFGDVMTEMACLLPHPAIALRAYEDYLPKTVRVLKTGRLEDEAEPLTFSRATESGLLELLRSPPFNTLVANLCGHPVEGPVATQVLCYRPGDYSGPHTDHVPEYPQLRSGYTDVHLTFTTSGVKQQLLVYEHERHLSEVVDITCAGTLTAYRLPFWHYTTPLLGTPEARRWLVLGTFIHPGRP